MSTTPTQPRDWKEGRRLRAYDLWEQGWQPARIAEALCHRPPPGGTPKLSAAQRATIPALLAKGAQAYGFIGDVWTTKRVATVIGREVGVRHHPAHISRVLRAIGWTQQKPIRRATQRDEAAIAAWRDTTRVEVEKKGGG